MSIPGSPADKLPAAAPRHAAPRPKIYFAQIPIVVLNDKRLTPAERELYVRLAYMDRVFRGRVYPSQEYLADLTGCTRATIQRQLDKLRSLGLVRTTKKTFAGNLTYHVAPVERIYSRKALDAAKSLPARGTIRKAVRLPSASALDRWWAALDKTRLAVGTKLCAARDALGLDVRAFQRFLYFADNLFDSDLLEGPEDEFPQADLMWVATRPLRVVAKPDSQLEVQGPEIAVVVLAAGVELSLGGRTLHCWDGCLIMVQGDHSSTLHIRADPVDSAPITIADAAFEASRAM